MIKIPSLHEAQELQFWLYYFEALKVTWHFQKGSNPTVQEILQQCIKVTRETFNQTGEAEIKEKVQNNHIIAFVRMSMNGLPKVISCTMFQTFKDIGCVLDYWFTAGYYDRSFGSGHDGHAWTE
jgi:hypothetical protein